MDIWEYSIGIGGWISVLCMVALWYNGARAVHPVLLAFVPCIVMLCTYILLTVCKYILSMLLYVLAMMFHSHVIGILCGTFLTAIGALTISNTVHQARIHCDEPELD